MAVTIPIISEFDGKGISKAVAEFKNLEGAGAKAQFALKKAAIPAAAAIGGLAVVIGDATKAAIEDAKAQALLAQAITNNTLAGEANIKVAEAFIESTMMSAAVADDELRPALASLVQVTGEMTSAQDGLTLALDIAAATGVDLGTATDAIAKAYGGNTKALGTLLPSVRELIKEGASLDQVFMAVAGTVGGSAAVAANSAEGEMKKLSLTIGETKEAIGAAFLPILEKLLPRIQKLAELAQNNSDVIVKLILVIGSLAASVLTINGIMRVYAATLAIVDLTTKALDASNYGLNLSYASLGSRLGLFTAVVASLGITIQGLGMDGGAVFKDLSGRVAQFINLGIAGFELLANSAVQAVNYINKAFNVISPIDVPLIPNVKLPRLSEQPFGAPYPIASSSPTNLESGDVLSRRLAVPVIPTIAPVTLPAPSGGGGGGSRGGGGGQMTVQPFDPSVYDPKSRYYEVPAMLDAAYAPKQAVYNVTVNSTIADERLGDTIVNALKQYNRRSGPLDVQIA